MVIPVLTPNSKRNVIHKKRPNTLLDPTTAGAGAERKMESTDDMSVEISWVDDGEYSIGTRDEVRACDVNSAWLIDLRCFPP